jgi:hypothetical protein
VRLTALVAHPDLDATIEIDWIRCRGDDGAGFEAIPCPGNLKERLGSGTSTTVEPIRIAFDDLSMGVDAITALAADPRDLFSGVRAFFNVQATVTQAAVEADTTVLEGTKRLLIFDPTIVSLVLREARARGAGAIPMIEGVQLPTLCTNVSETEFGAVLDYLGTRQRNRAPAYASIEYIPPAGTGTVAYVTGPIFLRPDQPVTFRGRVLETDKETYRVIDDQCRLVELSETMSWSWFTNVGDLSDQVTSEGQTPRASEYQTTWRAPPATELEQQETRVKVWSVLRDGRGGSDSRSVDLVILRDG